MADQRFLPAYRIRKGDDFRRAFQRRASAGDALLVLYAHRNSLTHPRLGISASRKLGPAVARNRWKRLLREAFRIARQRLPEGVDLVIVPRRDIEPTLAGLLESLPRLASRAARKLP
jgi:ribonuclease P protein component